MPASGPDPPTAASESTAVEGEAQVDHTDAEDSQPAEARQSRRLADDDIELVPMVAVMLLLLAIVAVIFYVLPSTLGTNNVQIIIRP